ncbi:MAG: ferritin-like domain-containing protein [Caldilineaceae bacterium]
MEHVIYGGRQLSATRRCFLHASAVAVVTAAFTNTRRLLAQEPPSSASSDIEILNYALTLEHLESRFYQDVNNIDLLTGRAREIFLSFGDQEAAHVVALTGLITERGGMPVRALAQYNHPDFRDATEVLAYFQFTEELGAAAYLGQAPLIQEKGLLTAAISIHNVEGQHAATLGELVGDPMNLAFPEPKTMAEVLEIIAPIISTTPTAMPNTGRVAVPSRRYRRRGLRAE